MWNWKSEVSFSEFFIKRIIHYVLFCYILSTQHTLTLIHIIAISIIHAFYSCIVSHCIEYTTDLFIHSPVGWLCYFRVMAITNRVVMNTHKQYFVYMHFHLFWGNIWNYNGCILQEVHFKTFQEPANCFLKCFFFFYHFTYAWTVYETVYETVPKPS